MHCSAGHSGDPWTHCKVFPGTQTPFSAWVGKGEQEKARKALRWLCPTMQKEGEVTNTCSDPTNTDSPSNATSIAGGMVCLLNGHVQDGQTENLPQVLSRVSPDRAQPEPK